jgi:surface protein
MGSMFEGCEGLTSIDISHFNISKVTNMSKMFKGCTNLTTLVLNGLDISKVSDMSDMLSGVCNIEDIRMKNTDVACVNKIISVLETVNDKVIIYINNQADELPTIDKDTATTKNCRICYREGLNIQHVDNSIKLIGKHIKSITSGPAYL